jgi:hypothetical protein
MKMQEESMIQTIMPKSDQLNADDLIIGPITVTIDSQSLLASDQPVVLGISGYPGRPYKPSKSMRRVLAAIYGEYMSKWVGRKLTLYCDPDVTFGKDKTGGIKISHASGIPADVTLMLTAKRGKRAPHTVCMLNETAKPAPAPTTPYPAEQFAAQLDQMRGSIASGKSTADKIVAYCLTIGTLTPEQEAAIRAPAAEPVTTEEDVF